MGLRWDLRAELIPRGEAEGNQTAQGSSSSLKALYREGMSKLTQWFFDNYP